MPIGYTINAVEVSYIRALTLSRNLPLAHGSVTELKGGSTKASLNNAFEDDVKSSWLPKVERL